MTRDIDLRPNGRGRRNLIPLETEKRRVLSLDIMVGMMVLMLMVYYVAKIVTVEG